MNKKNRITAALLALFFGSVGLHRFYLNQTGLGIFFIALLIMTRFWAAGILGFVGIIDAIAFLMMSDADFDNKYNNGRGQGQQRGRIQRQNQRMPQRNQQRRPVAVPKYQTNRQRPTQQAPRQVQRPAQRHNPFKQSGIQKYKEFELEEAIKDFQKGLEISPKDISLHFNIACAYSLTEQADKAYYHIERAVQLGFNDFDKIRTHDDLAFVRIQPQWDEFSANGFKNQNRLEAPKEDLLDSSVLLDQLNKLSELKEKGLITEAEFQMEKKKLMNR
ncbi:MAG: NINE protein [Bacteroidota bacterium]